MSDLLAEIEEAKVVEDDHGSAVVVEPPLVIDTKKAAQDLRDARSRAERIDALAAPRRRTWSGPLEAERRGR